MSFVFDPSALPLPAYDDHFHPKDIYFCQVWPVEFHKQQMVQIRYATKILNKDDYDKIIILLIILIIVLTIFVLNVNKDTKKTAYIIMMTIIMMTKVIKGQKYFQKNYFVF